MQYILDTIKTHFTENKKVYFVYLLVSVISLMIIFLLYRNSLDLPFDVILIPILAITMPALLTVVTIVNTEEKSTEMLVVSILIPLIIVNIELYLYVLLRQFVGGYFEVFPFMFIIGLPLQMFFLLIMNEFSNRRTISLIIGLVIVIAYFGLLHVVEDLGELHQTSLYSNIQNIVFFFIIPIVLLFISHKKSSYS